MTSTVDTSFELRDLAPGEVLSAVTERRRGMGFRVGVEQVGYEFQKGGDQMLRITHP